MPIIPLGPSDPLDLDRNGNFIDNHRLCVYDNEDVTGRCLLCESSILWVLMFLLESMRMGYLQVTLVTLLIRMTSGVVIIPIRHELFQIPTLYYCMQAWAFGPI